MQMALEIGFNQRHTGAVIDTTGRYRYTLWRIWNVDMPRATFIMLNPSTADENDDDPTIRRCIGFAKEWGFGSLEVVNLFAYRATNPNELFSVKDPIGNQNDNFILKALERSSLVILAWGTKGRYLNRDGFVLDLLQHRDLYAIDISKDGYPKHPLYLRKSSNPKVFQNSLASHL